MAATAARSEQDVRLGILNTLLTTPHRKLEALYPLHSEMVKQDPRFYLQLAAWYADTGEVRDHQEMFIVNLCLSETEGHRDVGLAMLRELPPYQLLRVVDFIHGRKKTKKIKGKGKGKGKDKAKEEKTVTESFGLDRTLPRSLKTEVERYLREREADTTWFDSAVLGARKALKRLYALLHVKPSEHAQQILFDDKPPEGSSLHALKLLAQAKTPADQAKAIIEHKIPYRVATTVVSAITPTVLVALIEVMSPQELINSVGALRKRGAFDNEEIKALIERKLEKAKTGKRVSALKASEAIKATNLSDDVKKQLEQVADAQIKSKGRIKRPTALFVDKSGSMVSAIELGKRVASMVSAIADAPLFVYAFDSMAMPISAKGTELADWERAFAGIKANGGTSCGSPFAFMVRNKEVVEQVILITDGGETSSPSFVDGYQRYVRDLAVSPSVCVVHVPGDPNSLVGNAGRANIAVDVWEFNGDYYSLPNLVKFLTRPSKLDLLMDIMQWELPKRKAS